MIRGKTLRVTAATAAAALILSVASPAMAANSVLLSALLPGLGQAQDGHYGKATVFASAAIISWVGLFATQINYSRSVDKYEAEKRVYLGYADQLENGTVVKQSDIDGTFQSMNDAFSQADDEQKYRDVFVGALVVTYGLNLVDILLSRPNTGEIEEPATSMQIEKDGFRVVRTFHF
ncbi:MAG TPA: DUF5683 domain-containing protein [Candidatus Krumholzibacteria bacterium]